LRRRCNRRSDCRRIVSAVIADGAIRGNVELITALVVQVRRVQTIATRPRHYGVSNGVSITRRELAAYSGETGLAMSNSIPEAIGWMETDLTGQISPGDFIMTVDHATLTMFIIDFAPTATPTLAPLGEVLPIPESGYEYLGDLNDMGPGLLVPLVIGAALLCAIGEWPAALVWVMSGLHAFGRGRLVEARRWSERLRRQDEEHRKSVERIRSGADPF